MRFHLVTGGCPENETVSESVTLEWPGSPVGTVVVQCPCGNITPLLPVVASRMCVRGAFNQPQWEPADVSQCQGLDFNLCNISEVC